MSKLVGKLLDELEYEIEYRVRQREIESPYSQRDLIENVVVGEFVGAIVRLVDEESP